MISLGLFIYSELRVKKEIKDLTPLVNNGKLNRYCLKQKKNV